MVKVRATEAERPPRRHTTDPTQERTLAAMRSSVRRTATTQSCEDCRAATAFQLWHDQDLSPSFNWEIDFSDEIDISAGHRAVIELVTATIIVPAGEWARLRMYTSLGDLPSNLDLWLTQQGAPSGQGQVLVATHSLRAYSDALISFNVNRDNALTSGYTLICVSGYLATI